MKAGSKLSHVAFAQAVALRWICPLNMHPVDTRLRLFSAAPRCRIGLCQPYQGNYFLKHMQPIDEMMKTMCIRVLLF